MACELYLHESIRERMCERREISPSPGLRAGPEGTLPQQKMPTFPLWPPSSQSPTIDKAADHRSRAPGFLASAVPRLSSFNPHCFPLWLYSTAQGTAWGGQAESKRQAQPICFQRNGGKGKEERPGTPLQAPLGRWPGTAAPSTFIQGASLSPSWPQKTELPPVSPESFPLGPPRKR